MARFLSSSGLQLLAFACLLTSVGGPLADALPPVTLREVNVFHSAGSHVGEFNLETSATVEDFKILGSTRAIAILRGPDATSVASPSEEFLGQGRVLQPGLHRLYLVGEGHAPAQARLRLGNLRGEATFELPQFVGGHFAELPHEFSLGAAGAGVHRFEDHRAFERSPYAGFYIEETYGPMLYHSTGWRWSMDGGVALCIGYVGAGVAFGGSSSVLSFVGVDMGPVVELAYFRETGGAVQSSSVMGYWIERAPGDVPTTARVQPAPSPAQSHKLLDHDPACRVSMAMQAVHEAQRSLEVVLPDVALRHSGGGGWR